MVICALCRLPLRLGHNEDWEGVGDNTPQFVLLCVCSPKCVCLYLRICISANVRKHLKVYFVCTL